MYAFTAPLFIFLFCFPYIMFFVESLALIPLNNLKLKRNRSNLYVGCVAIFVITNVQMPHGIVPFLAS